MARMMDTARGFRTLIGSRVMIEEVGTGERIPARVWSAAPHNCGTITNAAHYREEIGATKAADRETVYAFGTGGRVLLAEVNVETGEGFGEIMRRTFRHANRHAMSDAEIVEALPNGVALGPALALG